MHLASLGTTTAAIGEDIYATKQGLERLLNTQRLLVHWEALHC